VPQSDALGRETRALISKLSEREEPFYLNVFFSRLLFCFFAEDTGVFTKEDKNIFTNAVKDFTQTAVIQQPP